MVLIFHKGTLSYPISSFLVSLHCSLSAETLGVSCGEVSVPMCVGGVLRVRDGQ